MAGTQPRRSRGWWYPWIFVAGMVLVVAVNGVLLFLAIDTWTGLETHDSYRKGIEYNKALAGAKAQAALGWTMDLAFVAGGSGGREGDLTATFRDGGGEAVTDLEVEARMIRPTHEGYDTTAALKDRGGGLYGAGITLPLPGQWTVRVHARRGGDTFQASQKIQVP